MTEYRDFRLQYQFEITNKLDSMKYEDFYKQMNSLKDEERKVISKIYALKRKYVSELSFKVGDKVEIKYFGIGWLKEIKMTDYGSLQVNFYPPKKNGERSSKYRCAWNIKLEDIKLL